MFKDELHQMVALGVIVPVNEPTEWVNSIVLSKTTNDDGVVTRLRICLDPRDLNKWVKLEHYYTKTPDEVRCKVLQYHRCEEGLFECPTRQTKFTTDNIQQPLWQVSLLKTPFRSDRVTKRLRIQKELDTTYLGRPAESHRNCR